MALYAIHQGAWRNQRKKRKQGKYSVLKDSSDRVWENKFSTEFTWILEFLPSKEESERRQVDRFLCCKVINDLGSGRGFDAFKARGDRVTLRALHNRRRLWNFFSKIIEEYLPLSKQHSAPKPKAESLPEVSKSTSTPMASTLVHKSTPTAIDIFKRPLKGSKPWPYDPNELRNKSPIQARSMENLTLAARNSDLHHAVCFGVDANTQGFDIHFEDNGRKWSHCIGSRSTVMRYLYFDKLLPFPDKIILAAYLPYKSMIFPTIGAIS
ncbi:hypothetical protein FOYG_00991 [Fusarium oxysporum NRRL 32931]|uniref:Uncharacterized protein n=1 Tax=Fusarium oxysporum NRRL 32931 TaxID=660029 RepID=W9J900_FUSOX|nr:hypothetical protein FOYG_00991 [Fusarium oxysporum NRRL 32931]